MSKRPNLAEITAAAGSTRRQVAATVPAATLPIREEEGRGASSAKPRVRAGMRQVAGHFPEDVSWQLRELSVEQRTSVQELRAEALNNLFQKYGKPELVPSRRRGLS
jgi:hypothetical protein